MTTGCTDKHDSACPFACTEQSEQATNYGCLPSIGDIITMRTEYQKTWACHDNSAIPCVGAIRALKRRGLPHKVVDPELLTLNSPWHLFTQQVSK